MKKLAVLLVLVVAILSLTGCGNGSLTGTVTDSHFGAAVAGATVTVGDVSVKTDAEGKYSIPKIAAKSHRITVIAPTPAYGSYQGTVLITKNEPVTFDVRLAPYTKSGVFSGTVTNSRGGGAVAGANIVFGEYTTITDANGHFEITGEVNVNSTLYVYKEGYGKAKVQNFLMQDGEFVPFEIPIRPQFNPDWTNIPTISVANVNAGDVVSGNLEFDVTIGGGRPGFVLYAYLNGYQRGPNDHIELDSNEANVAINTKNYPNGPGFLRLLAYDDIGNSSTLFIPITISNTADDTVLPGDLPTLSIDSMTFGVNAGLYSKQREAQLAKSKSSESPHILKTKDGTSFDLRTVPEDCSLFVRLDWDEAANADGYSVYRSFDGNNFTWIGNVANKTAYYYQDTSPLLAENRPVWYRVEPYNSFGKGKAITRGLIPLPSYSIVLLTPENEANEVGLIPTFTWKAESTLPMPDSTIMISGLSVFDATAYLVVDETVVNIVDGFSFDCPIELAPSGVYMWDIWFSSSYVYYEDDDYGYACANSCAGGYDPVNGYDYGIPGSANGEFYFTTTTNLR